MLVQFCHVEEPCYRQSPQVTLGDAQAAKENKNKKTSVKRKGCPVFDILIEVKGQGEWRLHRDVAGRVDSMLNGGYGDAERRQYGSDGKQMLVSFETPRAAQLAAAAASGHGHGGRSYAVAAAGSVPRGVGEGSNVSAGAWLMELIQSAATLGSAANSQ
jgi:hypothetical protein